MPVTQRSGGLLLEQGAAALSREGTTGVCGGPAYSSRWGSLSGENQGRGMVAVFMIRLVVVLKQANKKQ